MGTKAAAIVALFDKNGCDNTVKMAKKLNRRVGDKVYTVMDISQALNRWRPDWY